MAAKHRDIFPTPIERPGLILPEPLRITSLEKRLSPNILAFPNAKNMTGWPCCCEGDCRCICDECLDTGEELNAPCCWAITLVGITNLACNCATVNGQHGVHQDVEPLTGTATLGEACTWSCSPFCTQCDIDDLVLTVFQDGADFKIKVELSNSGGVIHHWEKNYGETKPNCCEIFNESLTHISSASPCDSSSATCVISATIGPGPPVAGTPTPGACRCNCDCNAGCCIAAGSYLVDIPSSYTAADCDCQDIPGNSPYTLDFFSNPVGIVCLRYRFISSATFCTICEGTPCQANAAFILELDIFCSVGGNPSYTLRLSFGAVITRWAAVLSPPGSAGDPCIPDDGVTLNLSATDNVTTANQCAAPGCPPLRAFCGGTSPSTVTVTPV